MADIRNPILLWTKAALFLLLGILASVLLLLRDPEVIAGLLLLLAVWSFCRCYYFVFYVIQHYVDPEYRFSGLIDFLRYAVNCRRNNNRKPPPGRAGTDEE